MTIEQAIGLGALVALVVGIVKKAGWVPDGYAGLVAVVGNLAILAFLDVSKALCSVPDAYCPDVAAVDSIAGVVAQLGALLLPYLAQLVGSLGAHKLARALIPKGTKLLTFKK